MGVGEAGTNMLSIITRKHIINWKALHQWSVSGYIFFPCRTAHKREGKPLLQGLGPQSFSDLGFLDLALLTSGWIIFFCWQGLICAWQDFCSISGLYPLLSTLTMGVATENASGAARCPLEGKCIFLSPPHPLSQDHWVGGLEFWARGLSPDGHRARPHWDPSLGPGSRVPGSLAAGRLCRECWLLQNLKESWWLLCSVSQHFWFKSIKTGYSKNQASVLTSRSRSWHRRGWSEKSDELFLQVLLLWLA